MDDIVLSPANKAINDLDFDDLADDEQAALEIIHTWHTAHDGDFDSAHHLGTLYQALEDRGLEIRPTR